MEIITFSETAHVRKGGSETFILTPPSKIKIQVTGQDARTLLDVSPPQGKKWNVMVRVDVEETDE